MKLLLKIAFATLIFFSCTGGKDTKDLLDKAESLLAERPYEAIVMLQEMDGGELSSQSLRAKHSLLLAIAMEQMYMEPADLSIMFPALEYYSKKGSDTEKLTTYYHCAKAYLAAGDTEMAMECLVKGLREGAGSLDNITRGKILYEKGCIHKSFYEWEKFVAEMTAAHEIFSKEEEDNLCFNSLANIFHGYMELDDSNGARGALDSLTAIAMTTNITHISTIYNLKLKYAAKYGNKRNIQEIMPQYLESVPESYVDWLSVGNVLLGTGEMGKALEAIKKFDTYSMDKPLEYWNLASRVHEAIGNKDEALKYYRRYTEASDSLEMALLANDTRFIEERYALQIESMEKQSQKRKMAIYGLCLIFALLSIIAYAVYRLRMGKMETKLYRSQCGQLEREKADLAEILENSWVVSANVKDIIKERLELLNTIMAANISENDKIDRNAQQKIEQYIKDRKSFMDSTVAAFETSHPSFISHLRERGLTEMELGYCCLYAIGLNGKNVGEYTRMSRHYIINSGIRKKLSLDEKSTNLDKYIQQLLK